ncbi:homeobox protein NANOG [Eucyclogobius newberryi]|uniref:homeobox protein NANOG n=1 Tax=Eucyclogobius newberryi TaxID=166745 RepID=UPI003B5C6F71
MADWKAQINYNYNTSYHAYAYSLMYQNGSEQNHVHLSSWADPGHAEAGHHNYTPSQGYYPPAAAPQSPESPPESPEPHVYSGHGQYHSAGVYLEDDAEESGLLTTGQPHEHESRRTGSDSASDSEPHTSPDSWRSGSSGEGCLPQADPTTWAKTDLDDETCSRSPGSNKDIPVKEETQTHNNLKDEGANNMITSAPLIAPKNQSTTKGKVRASFSESQMNALAQRFNVQRYLTPVEMKNLAEFTGLTYKQVKTWFQNRRMKLRRHQKDNTWASERYTTKDNAGQGPVYVNLPSHMQPYEGQPRPVRLEAAMKKTTPPNLAFYLAAMGGVSGSNGYPAWSPNAAQNTLHSRPQAPSWPLPSDTHHFDYSAFNHPDAVFKEGEQINRAAHSTVIVQGTTP